MRPDDPCMLENTRNQQAQVNLPDVSINLETIRKKLVYRYYKDLEEYIQEMQTLFDNQTEYMGRTHKLYIQVENMRKRFFKFIEKNRHKLANTGAQNNQTTAGPSETQSLK